MATFSFSSSCSKGTVAKLIGYTGYPTRTNRNNLTNCQIKAITVYEACTLQTTDHTRSSIILKQGFIFNSKQVSLKLISHKLKSRKQSILAMTWLNNTGKVSVLFLKLNERIVFSRSEVFSLFVELQMDFILF